MGDGTAKPEDMKVAVKMGTDLAGTIAKLKANGFQYATAGDTRRLIEEIERCHGRLEIDHVYRAVNGAMRRVELPFEDRAVIPDGISCRDETIKLLDAHRDAISAIASKRWRTSRRGKSW